MTKQNWRMRTKTMCWSNQSSALVIMWQVVWSRSGCKCRKDSGSSCHGVRTECFEALWTEVDDYLWIYMYVLRSCCSRNRPGEAAGSSGGGAGAEQRSDPSAAAVTAGQTPELPSCATLCFYDSSWKSFLSGQCISAPPRCADGLLLSGGVGAATGPLGGV